MQGMELGREGPGDIDAVKSDGTIISHVQSAGGVTLTDSATFYFPLGTGESPFARQTGLVSVHLKWAAALAATLTVETSNMPRKKGGMTVAPQSGGANDVTDYSATAGDWIAETLSAAPAVVGTGNSSTTTTITAGGTNAGGAMIHLGNLGSKRARIKVVVTTGALVRCNVHGKLSG